MEGGGEGDMNDTASERDRETERANRAAIVSAETDVDDSENLYKSPIAVAHFDRAGRRRRRREGASEHLRSSLLGTKSPGRSRLRTTAP